jgi:hypothetical protein
MRLVESVVAENRAKLDDTAPHVLRVEGRDLAEMVARWADLGPLERRLAFDRMMIWARAVGEWRTK